MYAECYRLYGVPYPISVLTNEYQLLTIYIQIGVNLNILEMRLI